LLTEFDLNLSTIEGNRFSLPILLPIPKSRMKANYSEQICQASESGRPLHIVLADDGTAPFGAQRLSGESGARLHLEPKGGPSMMPRPETLAGVCPARLARDRGQTGEGRTSTGPRARPAAAPGSIRWPVPHSASQVRHAPAAGRGAVGGDRCEPRPLRHAHDRAALRPSRPVARSPIHPRDHAEARARRAEPGCIPSDNASAGKKPVGACVGRQRKPVRIQDAGRAPQRGGRAV
jgi:hypothetical protein